MAGKVNTRFVVMLSVGLLAVCGLLAWAVLTFALNSAADHIRNGDRAMAEGEYELAKTLYGKAVSNDRTNVEYLEKWVGAIAAITPETETAYRDAYSRDLVPAIRQIANVQRTNVEAHKAALDEALRGLDYGYNRSGADQLVDLATAAAAFFDRAPGIDPGWKALLRYRGLAREMILSTGGVLNDDEVALIGSDLESALEADPGDSRSMAALMRWRVASARRAATELERASAVSEARTRAIEDARAFLADKPGDPLVMAMKVFFEIDELQAVASDGKEGAARTEAIMQAFGSSEEKFDELEGMVLAQIEAGREVNRIVLNLMGQLERMISPETRLSRTIAVAERAREAQPDNVFLTQQSAVLHTDAGQLEEASALLATLDGLEPTSVSLDGLMRYTVERASWATRAQVELDLLDRDRANGIEDDGVRLNRIKELRGKYAGGVSEDNEGLVLLNARIAEAEGRDTDAMRLYGRYNERTGNANGDALWLQGRLAMKLGQTGTAREALESLVNVRPADVRALAALADIYMRLQQTRRASEVLRQLLEVSPGNELGLTMQQRIAELENPDLIEDPVVSVLMRSRQMRTGSLGNPADPAGASALLGEQIESLGYDPRVAGELIRVRIESGDLEGARAVSDRALELHPGDESLEALARALESDDPVEVFVGIIMGSDRPQQEKLLSVAGMYMSRGMSEQVDATLAELASIAPEDAQVIELQFIRALQRGDRSSAEVLVERAASQNLDNVNGLTYRARLLAEDSRLEEAVEVLEQATALGTADGPVFRLLGMYRSSLGRVDAAVAAFEEALSIRPDDLATSIEYVTTLATAGRYAPALDLARRQQRYGLSSPRFVQMWLSLEAAAGGDEGRVLAIEQRERMLESNPSDLDNRFALARLYIVDKNWADAKTLVDGLMSDDGGLRAVELLANWYADQGRVGNQDGLVLASQTYQRYVRGLGDELDASPFISMARFMLARGRQDLAVNAADQAIQYESPETMEGTKLKGELLMALGQPQGAAAAFQQVIDAGLDTEKAQFRQRLIEMYLRAGRPQDAAREMEKMPESERSTLTTLLQRAEIRSSLDDKAGERRILDEAASKYPDAALVFIKRAQSMLGEPELRADLLSDIDTALNLSPNDWRALRVRAVSYFEADRRSEAMQDLREVLRGNPSLDDTLFTVMNELLNEDRLREAVDAAREVLEARSNDAPLMFQLGKLFESRGDWREAAEMFQRAWRTRRSPADGASFIDAALRLDPPDVAGANAVITDLAGMVEGGIESSPGLLAAQALVLRARGREDFAIQQMTKAFDISRSDPRQIQTWGQNAVRFYLDVDATQEMNYYRSLRARYTDAATRAWIDVIMAQRELDREIEYEEAISTLERLTEDTSVSETIRVIAFRALGNEAFDRGDFEEAVARWKRGLESVPNNWELNNNAAYVLSSEMGQYEEALVLAERAIQSSPTRSEPYDTIAGIYIALGRLDEAEQMVQEGEQRSRTYTARVTMTITRAKLEAARGNNEKARSLLRSARGLLRTVAGRDELLEAEIDKAESRIDSDG